MSFLILAKSVLKNIAIGTLAPYLGKTN